ncbi:hypothetical protein STCU_05595 [Strigomonas culicis]|uniref:Uncharacterized protein n=1 Tax=Strigomonas culicis TaxID=28005 RepID=S9UFQ3_9TRYP|nr:hypothetical protein STCU_05595 [Strigomonas culicis]|eukprot:EPY27743.1 hypothetical protein STCU_05595 [Strigomonas culicis]
MHGLVDAALKNIAFETEAAVGGAPAVASAPPVALTRKEVVERVRRVANLSWDELVELLSLAGDLEIPFHISAEKVTEHLLLPMLRFLHGPDLIALLRVIRQTKCKAPLLLAEFTHIVARQKPTAPYTYPVTHAMVKVLLQEPSLMLDTRCGEEVASTERALREMPAAVLLHFFFGLIERHHTHVCAKELAQLGDTLYALSRQSHYLLLSLGDKARALLDAALCRQMERLLQVEVARPADATRLLEHTVVLRMRAAQDAANAALYPHTQALLRTRNAAVARRERDEATRRQLLEEAAGEEVPPSEGDHDTIAVRWESLSDQQLPAVPKAAFEVYRELIYMLERMTVVKATVSDADKQRFSEVLFRTGLYNIFLGGQLFKNAHFHQEEERSASDPTPPLPRLPMWVETAVSQVILKKLNQLYQHNPVLKSGASSKGAVAEEFLHTLGQIYCDAEKVRQFKACVLDSPFRVAKQKREVWIFLCDITQFFWEREGQGGSAKHTSKTLF